MTIDKEETKNSRKPKQPINEKSPLLPEKDEGQLSSGELNGASFTGSVFNLSTSIIGAGIMALPATMKVLGLGLGLGLIVFVALLTEASLEMLLRFSKVGNSESYGEVMGDAFGGVGRRLLQFCIFVNNVGTLIVYMIIIGKAMPLMIDFYFSQYHI
jgi:sodium-coupled neutral amino acid transporter 2